VHEDEKALSLEEVYCRHLGFVWRSLAGLGIPEDFLEDAAHEVFMIVHRKLDTFDGSSTMTTWLYGIARRVAANHRRSHVRAARRRIAHEPVASIAPDEGVSRNEARELVARFLDTLDPAAREIFRLRDVEGLRAPEIANLLGLNVNTVYSRSRAARKRFRDYVQRALRATREGKSA
jgi:RNA polymerase sigma-70 factor (ECF subfamily)